MWRVRWSRGRDTVTMSAYKRIAYRLGGYNGWLISLRCIKKRECIWICGDSCEKKTSSTVEERNLSLHKTSIMITIFLLFQLLLILSLHTWTFQWFYINVRVLPSSSTNFIQYNRKMWDSKHIFLWTQSYRLSRYNMASAGWSTYCPCFNTDLELCCLLAVHRWCH